MVIEMSSSGPTSRNIRTSVGRSARTVGSPPVTLIERTPSPTKMPSRRADSSNVRISLLGSQASPSAGMQYVQRKLHRSVTETRRSSAIRPNESISGPSAGGGVVGGSQGGHATSVPGTAVPALRLLVGRRREQGFGQSRSRRRGPGHEATRPPFVRRRASPAGTRPAGCPCVRPDVRRRGRSSAGGRLRRRSAARPRAPRPTRRSMCSSVLLASAAISAATVVRQRPTEVGGWAPWSRMLVVPR